ncbi:hypothetical protein DL768_007773 [Monosporascus sp. mg162]|nr:hypothetical protein DL768_007773 [Monosporascus sp. mg162]
MTAYVPPFRRCRAEGSSSDSPSADQGFRGGGGSQGQQSRGPPVDQADLYYKGDIANHFFCGKDPYRSSDTRSTSPNGSAAHPGELSSNLNLLPEYAAKMLEHDPRGSQWDVRPGGTQGHALESYQKADEPAAGDSITNEAADRTINDANRTEKGQFTNQGKTSSPTGASPGSSLTVTNDKSGGRPLPIDGLKVPNASTAEPTPPASPRSRMKYTDIPTIPAEEFENKREQNVSTFPSIQPIYYIPSAHPHIAVFEERWSPWSHESDDNVRFAFGGWYKVAQVALFAPHSAELLWMQQKWERRDNLGRVVPSRNRSALACNNAMSMRLAVVKFEKLAGDVPPPPAIEKLLRTPREEEAAAKGVDEMLAEMRMGDSSSSKEVGAHADGDEGPREAEIPGKQEAPGD